MADTSKLEVQGRDVVHHEYKQGAGDSFLALVKRLLPDPEARHHLLPFAARLAGMNPFTPATPPALERTLHFYDRSLPLTLASPFILAAGGNKGAESLWSFANLGFGGISVGSATREKRDGNPHRPRVALLPDDRSMANSMGLNNPGIDPIAAEVDRVLGRCRKRKLALGISIADTPGLVDEDERIADLLATFRKAYRAAEYIELNVSCPNTGHDRLDAHNAFLHRLLVEVMETRKTLAPKKAVFVKLSPDLSIRGLETVLEMISDVGVTGLVLFNTFPAEKAKYLKLAGGADRLPALREDGGKGGISGRILYKNTLPAVQFIKSQLPRLSVFAVGGVDQGAKALDLLEAGADAVQCYTVLAYRWNAVHKMNKELLDAMRRKGISNLEELVPAAHS